MGQILVGTQDRLTTLRPAFLSQFIIILRDARREISAVLTPEQQQRFDKYLAGHPFAGAAAGPGADTNGCATN